MLRPMTEAIASHLTPLHQRVADIVRRERVLVLIGCSLVGLHLVDDNFLQPQPGTSAGDHLVSGLVPLALVAGATLAYGRVRPGARAALALLLGYFGVLIGTEAAYYTVAGGRSGDDYTGLLSLLTGVLLLGAGTVMLWRSRRRNDRLVHRYLRRSLIGVGVLALIAIVLFPTALAYVVTHTLRGAVPAANLGADYEDVAFQTSDGLRLEGWFVPSRNGATVIVFPGRAGPQKQARMLIRHGYGVLLFDRRGEAASEGDPNIFGWVGDRDLHAAAAYLRSRADVFGADRRDRDVGRRRDVDPRRRALERVQGNRLGGRERPIRARRASQRGYARCRSRRRREHACNGGLHEHSAAAEPEERDPEDRPDRPVPHLRRKRAERQRDEAESSCSTRLPASRSRSGRFQTGSTSPGSPRRRRSTSGA